MKKVLKLVIVMAIILSSIGCASRKKQNIDYLLCNDTSRDNMAEVESGFFFIYNQRLYYADKSDMTKWVPVCNKADCNHNESRDCNAYVSSEIAQKGDKIYYVGSESKVNCLIGKEPLYVKELLLDGSGSKNVYQIPFDEETYPSIYRALISSHSLVLYYRYLTEEGMYQHNLARLEEDGTLYPMYSQKTEEETGGFLLSSSVFFVRGDESFVSDTLTLAYTDKTSIDIQSVFWRMDKEEPEMVPIPDEVSFSWSYLASDYMIDYEGRDGYEKGYYKYDFTTGKKTLLGKAEQDDAMGYVMTENCVVECNRYIDHSPEDAYLKIYYNEKWTNVLLPEVVTKVEKSSFVPLAMASDRIFFMQDISGSDGYSCRLYYVMLNDETPELTYCTTFGSDSYFDLSKVEESEDESKYQWHELDITVFDTEKCLLKVTGVGSVSKDEKNKYQITMYCENKNPEEELFLSLQDGAINGVYALIPQSICLNPGETSEEWVIDILSEQYGEFYDFNVYDFDEYTDISFLIYDIYDKGMQKVVHVYPYGEENAIKHKRESKPTDEVLIDNEYVTVTVVGYESNSIGNDTVNLFIENKSDTNIAWKREPVSMINGIEVTEKANYSTRIIQPYCCSYESIQLFSERINLAENNITSIENWELILKIWYGKAWDNELLNETFTITP